jgi:hypothetical protein
MNNIKSLIKILKSNKCLTLHHIYHNTIKINITKKVQFKFVKLHVEVYVCYVLFLLDVVDALTAVVAIHCQLLKVNIYFIHIVGLVESFGRFSRLLKPGLNMINPCAE